MTTTTIDPRQLRTCLGHFATGVTVVTCEAGGAPHGATVNSFTSVSMDPPLVLVSLHRDSRAARLLADRPFTVNVLAEEQALLARHFAGRGAGEPRWIPSPAGHAPRLAGSLATVSCTPWAAHDGGDHLLFLGRVEDFAVHRDGRPLVFYQGEFQRLGLAGAVFRRRPAATMMDPTSTEERGGDRQ
ncbi:flavin reductase family protein [Streptomyces sp. AV19]|uniref:flavin reductase family protein n=1 Tax=Streptomyces sp. AV19 TaxID=2793068 RepID=UPI0018FE75D2|nr:flavin reductase family protein [Streptomyces sp. AV19]MBH1938104.1 flavin reductase family protein [Streptomyces sp. AV19]MDG4536125.1 flavin reductase family protein [Streptomyces sp. AV19]